MTTKPIPRDLLQECYQKVHVANDMIEKLWADLEAGREIDPNDVNRFTEQMRTANAWANTLQLRVIGVKPPKMGD